MTTPNDNPEPTSATEDKRGPTKPIDLRHTLLECIQERIVRDLIKRRILCLYYDTPEGGPYLRLVLPGGDTCLRPQRCGSAVRSERVPWEEMMQFMVEKAHNSDPPAIINLRVERPNSQFFDLLITYYVVPVQRKK